MSAKEFIKCLTICFLILPSITSNATVKDIINSYPPHFLEGIDHVHEYSTTVYHYEFTENLNDDKQIVVVDAGHGGHDPGTHGKNSKEKDIALQIALKLGKELKSKSDNIEVIFTRKTDVFIPLHKRIAIANKKKADLFVSIHCNFVGNPDVCGTETFVMGLHRAEDNLNVAKRENSVVLLESEYESNYEGYDPNSPVGHILLSMIQNVFIDNSIELASNVEESFIKRKKTKSRGVKQAGFVVLRQATMPSILVETGFLSNAKEEKYLLSQKGQNEMAAGIGSGVIKYFKKHTSLKTTTPKEDKPIITKAQEPKKSNSKNQYIVQIGAFSKKKDAKFESSLANYGQVIIVHVGSVTKYAVGHYPTKADAQSICNTLKEDGFKDAFVKRRIAK